MLSWTLHVSKGYVDKVDTSSSSYIITELKDLASARWQVQIGSIVPASLECPFPLSLVLIIFLNKKFLGEI